MWHDHTFIQRNKPTNTAGERNGGRSFKRIKKREGKQYREVLYKIES